ncbi:GHKL domain-containing protein [Lactobacillus equicursoris]|nr:GHKL domain-containing protein [Lactobacillus equicursoris]
MNNTFELFSILTNIILSLIVDLSIFTKASMVKFTIPQKILVTIFYIFCFIASVLIPSNVVVNISITIAEILFFMLLGLRCSKDKFLILGSALLLGIFDSTTIILSNLILFLFPTLGSSNLDFFTNISIIIISYLLLRKIIPNISTNLTSTNKKVFIGVLSYVYISETILNAYVLSDTKPTEVIVVSLTLLFLQSIFILIMYIALVEIQKKLLSHTQQKELLQEKQELEEYSSYLDQNEDDLRRFKHDYQNILNSLKIDAQEGDVKGVIDKLSEYSNSQFSEEALRKYKDLNHIHIKALKSIVFSKLTQMYNLGISYNFGCEPEIYKIPQNIDLLDLVRVIGITFDNAIEAETDYSSSNALSKQDLRIEAMYYQDHDDFEFMIRNRIPNSDISLNQLAHKGYTTKKQHQGLGLANVKQFAQKYDNVIIDYQAKDNWFIFNLTILPIDEVLD